MRKSILIALALIALPMSVMAQMIPLLPSGSKNELWLDPDRIYDYNQYEKSRWGVGLQYDINFDTASKPTFKTLSLSGYGAYGYADQRFKWGVLANLQGASWRRSHTYVEFFHDLTAEASRTLFTPTLSILRSPASLLSRLFSDTYRFTLGFSNRLSKHFYEGIELRLSRERLLHDDYGRILYPTYSELKDLNAYNFAELHLTLFHVLGLSGKVTLGAYNTDNDKDGEFFVRTQLEYDRTIKYYFLVFQLFGQGGWVGGSRVPYSRMYDLGGSWGCPLGLNHTLLTVRPNEFTTSLFAMINLKVTTREPLFVYYNNLVALGTSPSPFLLCNGAWGTSFDDFYLAPEKGIGEVGAGIDGLLVWGLVDWGLGVVYRLTPASAVYHLTEPKNNFALFFTATLEL